jgi:DHA2 family multidrug resistance protein
MMAAILLRGLGLGFLFLSITLIAFGNLGERNRAFGIGLFNTSRQLGGLIGVAGLETLIEHHTAGNLTVLGANLTAGVPAVGERLTSTAAMLSARGMDALAGRVATSLLDGVLIRQSTVIAFDAAFNAVALLFVFAVPVLVTVKIGLHRYAQMRATQSRRIDAPRIAGVAVPVACASACNGSNCSTATAIALAQRQSRSGRPSPCPNSAWRAMGTNAAGTTKLEISSSRTDLPEDRALASADPAHATSL